MKIYFWKKYRIVNTGSSLSVLNTRTKFWKPFLLMLPSILTILLLTVIPFILVIYTSITPRVGFHANDIKFGIDHYKSIFHDEQFKIAIKNSLVYAILSLPISLVISLLISSAISQVIKKWARGFWQTVFFLPYVTSAIAVSMAFAYIFKTQGGMINEILLKLKFISRPIRFLDDTSNGSWNSFWIILIRGIWGSLAFQILILTTAMLSVNQDLYKSASIDGASPTKQFFTITLPAISKTITFLFTMGIIGGIKTFPLALFNNSSDNAMQYNGQSLMLYIFHFTKGSNFGRAGASSVVLFVLGIIISFGLRKIVFTLFRLGNKLGERSVINRIENSQLTRKALFKF